MNDISLSNCSVLSKQSPNIYQVSLKMKFFMQLFEISFVNEMDRQGKFSCTTIKIEFCKGFVIYNSAVGGGRIQNIKTKILKPLSELEKIF